MNARNIYISKYNSKASKHFADDKIYTKNFLNSRWVWVAKLFRTIKLRSDLDGFDYKSLPSSFVIKPNRGFWWEWIIVIIDKKQNWFLNINWEFISREDFYLHIISILDWKYAISWTHDIAIIEEALESHDVFKSFVEKWWLPDIRIIVFNLVPVIAMLRIPTRESEWKWNLAMWAIWAWIDIATWKTTYWIKNDKFIKYFPDWRPLAWLEIPDWDDILLSSSKIQQCTNIWYLWVDLVITKTWIKVLEINARPGLKIQICNLIPLKHRLETVKDLKILNSEQWVLAAKTLFWNQWVQKIIDINNQRPVIWLYEPVIIFWEKMVNTVAKIDPFWEENYIDKGFNNKWDYIDVSIQWVRIKAAFKEKDFSKEDYKAVIWWKHLWNFLISTSLKNKIDSSFIQEVNEKIIKNIDKKVCEIDKKIKFTTYIKPLNMLDQKDLFLASPNFNPQFEYKQIWKSELDDFRKEIYKIPRWIDHPMMKLYDEKIWEILLKLDLIEKRDTLEFWKISEEIFWELTYIQYKRAISFIRNHKIKKDNSKILDVEIVSEKLKKFLKDNKVSWWEVNISDDMMSDMSVSKWGNINISKFAKISENRLISLIAHEIETHVYRAENARFQEYEIFERWTKWYLETEEWLAIYSQNKLGIAQWEKAIWWALRVIAAYMWKKMTFLELFNYLIDTFWISDHEAWKTCMKVKRGLSDSSKLTTFTKDTIYFTWEVKVSEFIKKAWAKDIHLLYSWKVSLDSLKALRQIYVTDSKYLPWFAREVLEQNKEKK